MYRLLMCAVAGLIGPQPLRVVVNIPAYRLDAYVGDSLVRTIGAAVGMRSYPTPRGSFMITSIDWNPRWIPPDSPWAAKEKPMEPGPANPMGRVKLNFWPLYFLHGTPFAGSIGSAASHGCIRLKNSDAIELARLVHRFGTPALTDEVIDELAADEDSTRTIELDEPVPIEIRYDLVEIRDGRVLVYRDPYGLATRSLIDEVAALLAARGLDITQLDDSRLRALTRRVPLSGRGMSIDSLRVTPP